MIKKKKMLIDIRRSDYTIVQTVKRLPRQVYDKLSCKWQGNLYLLFTDKRFKRPFIKVYPIYREWVQLKGHHKETPFSMNDGACEGE